MGTDALGSYLLTLWRAAGVDISHIRRDPSAPTALHFNKATDSGDHRLTYWRSGSAGSRLRESDIDDGFYADLAFLVVTGVTLAVSRSSAGIAEAAIERARAAQARIACVLNHRPALGGNVEQLATVAGACDVLVASREEAAPKRSNVGHAPCLSSLHRGRRGERAGVRYCSPIRSW